MEKLKEKIIAPPPKSQPGFFEQKKAGVPPGFFTYKYFLTY